MTADATLWPKEIRRKTLLLLTFVALFGLVATGYVLWEKRTSVEVLLVMDRYHLASAFHCTASREEARRILNHVHEKLAGNARDAQTSGAAPDRDFNVASSLHLMRTRIEALIVLQDRFGDPRFAFLTQKLARQFADVEREAPAFRTSGAAAQVVDHLNALTTTLSQLERLHVIVYEALTAERESKNDGGAAVLLTFFFVILFAGVRFVRKGLKAIEGITISQRDAQVKLREAKAEADSANAAKSEFLAAMSHELRTPLNSVLGFAQVLGSTQLAQITDTTRVEYARYIQKAGEHLLALIEDILDLSKVEVRELALTETEFDVRGVLDEACAMLDGAARQKPVTVTIDCDRQLYALYADRRRVAQIVINLLSNAIKFNKSNGQVWLLVQRESDGRLSVSVRDTGIGIPAAGMAKVFEPFSQLRTRSDVAYEGTGLGLSLSLNLMLLHGGTIDLKSKVDEGTTATLVFPAARVTCGDVDEQTSYPRVA